MMAAADEDRHDGADQEHCDNQKDDEESEVNSEQAATGARLILGPVQRILLLVRGASGRLL